MHRQVEATTSPKEFTNHFTKHFTTHNTPSPTANHITFSNPLRPIHYHLQKS
eukprot:m.25001 g.25001  ORF g.25001 m.25001 type:complete len:52 (+) comp14836_c1_seq1:1012-1167(+)